MTLKTTPASMNVLIASPLELEQVERIRAAVPGARVVFEPDLLPAPRYVADHNGIKRALSQDEIARWRGMLAEADVFFDFDWLEPERMPRNAPRLRWVQATSAGIGEYLIRTGLAESSITFTTAAGVHAVPLSEFVVLGLLYQIKRVPWLRTQQRARVWERYTTEQLAGRTVVQVGLGNVGRQIARSLGALGVRVRGIDPGASERPPGVEELIDGKDLREALASADALVLSCPYTKETHHLIGRAELRAMKATAFVVNVARGAVIEEPELIAALREGRIGGAVLDVFETEPLPADNPLWDMPNVLVSPHSASTVDLENERIVDLFIDNLGRFLEGKPLRNVFVAAREF